jgi:hypothetical protein
VRERERGMGGKRAATKKDSVEKLCVKKVVGK